MRTRERLDVGPFPVSQRRIIAPKVGLYVPPQVRLTKWNQTKALYGPPPSDASFTVEADSGDRDCLMYWRGKGVAMDMTQLAFLRSGEASKLHVLYTTDSLLNAQGGESGSSMDRNALYYVYRNPDGVVKASATAPTWIHDGVRVLNHHANARDWLFIGYVRTDVNGELQDDATGRLVVNGFNLRCRQLLLTPGYVDNDAVTTYTHTSTSYAEVNGGVGARGSYIADGRHAVEFVLAMWYESPAAQAMAMGIGDNSATSAVVQSYSTANGAVMSTERAWIAVPAEGYRTVSILAMVSGGTGTIRADAMRNGSSVDPYATYLVGKVWC